jgi:hypothetical protein
MGENLLSLVFTYWDHTRLLELLVIGLENPIQNNLNILCADFGAALTANAEATTIKKPRFLKEADISLVR